MCVEESQRYPSRRRVIGSGLVAVGTSTVLAACGAPANRQPGPAESSAPATLKWFGKLKGISEGDVDAYVQQYKAVRPNVTLEVTSVSNTAAAQAALATYAAAGTPVDVLSSFTSIPDLRQLNRGFSLDSYTKRDKFDTSQFAPNAIRSVQVNGKLLALPHAYGGNNFALAANKAIFQRAGAELPSADWKSSWTWMQFREALKRLTNLNASPPVVGAAAFGSPRDIPPMWGAKWATDDARTALVDKPEMVQAWTEYYDFVVKDRSARFSPNAPAELGDDNGSFLTGKAATFVLCCAPPTTTATFKAQNIDWAFLPTPKAKNAVADVSATIIAVWSESKSPEEAWRFSRWSTEEGRLATLEQRMPTQNKAIVPYVQKFYGQTPDVRPDVLLHAPDYAFPPDALWQSPASTQAMTAITAAFADVQKGTKSVQAALTELKPQIQALLDQYRDQ